MAKIAEVIADILGPQFDRENVQNLADNVGSVVHLFLLIMPMDQRQRIGL